jgi:hypothetical protein
MPRRGRTSPAEPICPLTPERCEECREALVRLRNLEDEFRRAEEAGLDVSKQRQLRDEIAAAIANLLRVYSPTHLDGLT